jgi:tetraprenyl-beta-curcumene synthase
MGVATETEREALVFVRAARLYWLEIFPSVRRELSAWESRAKSIPDATLRRDALFTLRTKRGHAEGAAAFAVLVPRPYRRRVVRMMTSYEVMIDYLDTTSERPVDDPFGNTLRLHRAIYAALALGPPAVDDRYYALHSHSDDGGYLASHVAACREVFVTLPFRQAVTEAIRRFADLYAESQGLHHAAEAGRRETPEADLTSIEAARHRELQWGEVVAAGGSSLPVLALIATAAGLTLPERGVELLGAAYYPWASALHILLDGLVDQAVDRVDGRLNQLTHYRSPEVAARRLTYIASRARALASGLHRGGMHAAILAAMGGYYLAAPQVWEPDRAVIARGVLESLGPLAKPSLLVHRLRRGGPRAAMRPVGRALSRAALRGARRPRVRG